MSGMMASVTLRAPLTGWLAPIESVPDPVFAERMMGEGFAIDPIEGEVRAPADATVLTVAPTGHSVLLRLANGAELGLTDVFADDTADVVFAEDRRIESRRQGHGAFTRARPTDT